MEEQESQDDNSSNKKILETARKRFAQAEDAWADIRREAADDLKFSAGDQWPDWAKRERDADGRPCLTINRIPQHVRAVTNDQRMNRPAIRVSPVDDKADVETAKIYQGLARHIEKSSNADNAYDTAFDSSARCGYGFFRVITKYEDPMSFNQEIEIKRIADRFSAHLDPFFQEPDGSDANWGTVFQDFSPDEFKAMYPDAEVCGLPDWGKVAEESEGWVNQDKVRVAEYFYKEFESKEIYLLADGSVVESKEGIDESLIVDSRMTLIPQVKWVKHNGYEILEQTDWPGKWIPIIPVLGEELVIEGKRILSGVVRYAKDSQRMYNFWKSAETETITLAPKAPWIGDEGQFKGYESLWRSANRKSHAFLPYKSVSLNGQTIPPPQRNAFEPPVQAITQAGMFAADDLKATTGVYDAALGAKSNENSGKAIERRNQQSQTSNFHLIDNLNKSIQHCGRIVVDLIPHIYDTARAARILGEDGTEEVVRINEIFKHKGKQVIYQMGVGKYDVTTDTGPSFETKRQEAVAAMSELTRAYPQLMQTAGDIMVSNMDWPGAKDIAQRLKKTLPPGMDDSEDGQEIPPQIKGQLDQMGQMVEQLTQQLNEANSKIDNKTLELESKERIEMAKLENQATIELAKLESKEALEILISQIRELDARTKMLGMNQPFPIESNGPETPEFQAPINEQQPTGGLPPGSPMEGMP